MTSTNKSNYRNCWSGLGVYHRNSHLGGCAMKKTMIAALSALMLAGALSAVEGATSITSTAPAIVIGEGSAPIPLALPATDAHSDWASLTPKF
jgi:hypothetical protein